MFTVAIDAEFESNILSQSVVEIESSVVVEDFKDGFESSLGTDGFEVNFN